MTQVTEQSFFFSSRRRHTRCLSDWSSDVCSSDLPIHDHQDRTWRHLDTCQFKTFVHARVPRLNCPTHGIRQLRVAWAEPGSRFTALFEALAIDWLDRKSVV